MATATDQQDIDALRRRSSVGKVEITDSSGRRKTVELQELSEADRALAEQFGYKPVRTLSQCNLHHS